MEAMKVYMENSTDFHGKKTFVKEIGPADGV